jgi:hypothetical protein
MTLTAGPNPLGILSIPSQVILRETVAEGHFTCISTEPTYIHAKRTSR